MKRIICLLVVLMLPGGLSALGLGNLELKSALNEPFDAEIQLLSATANELDSLNINLADSDAFYRAGIDRPFVLSQLKFKLIRSETGNDFIRVSSQEAIREPFLNFLVEINWSNGRLFREYTVLLDPPLYDPNRRPVAEKVEEETIVPTSTPAAATPQPSTPTVDTSGHSVVYAEDFEKYGATGSRPAATPTVERVIDYAGGDYGPTDTNDTLWSIASATRPDSSVSVNQMMLALLQANPDAFLNNNINGLKKGQILKMPSEAELNVSSQVEALAEVNRQYTEWGQPSLVTDEVAERPTVAVTQPETITDSTEVAVEEDPELKLLAAGDSAGTAQQDTGINNASGDNIALAEESIQALTQENLDLKDQLQETEALLDDLKRLLQLKDDELALLQDQMGQEQVAPETIDAVTSETEIIEEETAEVIEEVVEPIAEETAQVIEEVVEPIAEETARVIEEVVEPVEEETAEVIEEVVEPIAEETAEVIEEVVEPVEEETIEVIEQEPATAGGIMDMIQPYLAPVTDLMGGNPLYAIAGLVVLVLLILIAVVMKFRKKSDDAETVEISNTADAFPEFDSESELDSADDLDSEAATIMPGTEDEMPVAEEELPDEPYLQESSEPEEDDATVIAGPEFEEEEEEEEEDPLQEVNTYLAFEQFDQAEEFVRNAINDNPGNPEFHTKLLEVFYTSGNKKSYEEEAKALHDLVNGEGEHWDMAVAMWSEMSPSRALFEEGADDDDEAADDSDTTGGFVDVTADSEAEEDDGLDFDIGAGVDSEETTAQSEPADELLDITAADESEDVLDVTTAEEGEDLLDVTAAVGLEDSGDADDVSAEEDDMLDISGSNEGEDLLDVTAASDTSGDEDVLDISSSGSDAGDDLLDVTAASNIELDNDEDLLDVTAATSAGADSAELLDLDNADKDDAAEDSDNVIDFDLAAGGGDESDSASDGVELDLTAGGEGSSDDDMSLDLDTGSDDSAADGLELDLTAGGDESSEDDMSLDLNTGSDDSAADGLELDLTAGGEESSADEISLDLDTGADDADSSEDEISLDFDIDADANESDDPVRLDAEESAVDISDADEFSLDIDIPDDDSLTDDSAAIELDIDEDKDEGTSGMDETVQLPSSSSSGLELDDVDDDDDDDDDDEDHTVFVPRASQPEEQSAEDEIATKLDLAKAYVELGDKDSAKTILDEVMADGNEEQKQQAQDLLSQV